MKNVETLIAEPQLRPLLPLFYVAWADGELSENEVTEICSKISTAIDEECGHAAQAWLDPNDPPTATELLTLLRALRTQASEISTLERHSLSALGVAIAKHESGEDPPESVKRALEEIDEALGFVGVTATRDIVGPIPAEPVPESNAAFSVARMEERLLGSQAEHKRKVRQLLVDKKFKYRYDIPKEEQREITLHWIQTLADNGLGAVAYPGVTYDAPDAKDFVATFETLAEFDHSMVIKYGVQFGLWGGSVFHLGTKQHHEKYLPKIASLEIPGCFAMSETGHGSNVRDCETTATYDPATKEFVVNTPHDMARKDWIGNAAKHGTMATVFAQLIVGGESYGVHALVVPLRDENGKEMPGVRIDDCGHKLGLNGIDNGRIWFDNVRIPKENLLDKYASVTDSGEYSSPIASSGKRFFTMLSTLVGGRVAVGAAAVAASKSSLAIATRYGSNRRQFGPSGKQEEPILNYRAHQRRLMPLLAKAYGLTFAFQYLIDEFVKPEPAVDVEALAAGLKSYATWNNIETVQTCRECCGGQGYLSVNRFADIRADTDIFATFEGDNTVLMQLVSKGRLTDFKKTFSGGMFSIVKGVAKIASGAVETRNPVSSRATDSATLRSADHQVAMLAYRDDHLQMTLAQRFQSRIGQKMDPFQALNEVQDHFLALAHAHICRVVLEQFAAAVEREEDEAIKKQLDTVRALLGVQLIFEDLGWFMENGVVESGKSRALRTELNALCEEVRDQAVHLVDAFGIPDELLAAPIGTGSISG